MKRSSVLTVFLCIAGGTSIAWAVDFPPHDQRPDPVGDPVAFPKPKFPAHPTTFYASMVPLNLGKIKDRCEQDNLSGPEAWERLLWLKNCHKGLLVATYNSINGDDGTSDEAKIAIIESEWFYVGGDPAKPKARPNYLTFGTATYENPLNWFAPRAASVVCTEFPAGYQVLGECTSSCYEPDQKLLFSEGEIPIAEALDKLQDQIVTLTDESTLDFVNLQNRKVKHYARSATPTKHEILTISSHSGGQLKVTKNHPILTAEGLMIEAGELKVGDRLVQVDGQTDAIVSISEKEHFGRVFNIQPEADTQPGQIVIAQGFLSGSSWFQNDGYEFINRLILRRNVPVELFQ
ncbi:MAG TPA: Hint domain-containing protein [Oligoflexus sp.]|uniref:Hint domain-containing protein n=1 Tax=Oligoflexus sp. TaxID=1971216 RepID=UPI002D3D2051|nr:Hint domain-containing protein [Oligoflexus sp.]HYX31778.1 Hint domain-containing protein [Oligoflexus sp.]